MRYLPFLIILLLSLNCFSQESKDMTLKVRKADTTVTPDVPWIPIADATPQFPGGDTELFKFLSSNAKYPQNCRDSSIQGTVYISFVIDTDGTLFNIIVNKGTHPLLDAEAQRVVYMMPKWKPAIKNGIPVRAEWMLPIKFKIH